MTSKTINNVKVWGKMGKYCTLIAILLPIMQISAQVDSVGNKTGNNTMLGDPIENNTTLIDDTEEKSSIKDSEISTTQKDSPSEKSKMNNDVSKDSILTSKDMRCKGWGEYQVRGKCLCCDNMVDGDCIIVFNTERTDKKRLTQIIDGNTKGDGTEKKSYFGDLKQREHDEYVSRLMAEFTLKKMQEITKIIVYTIIDEKKKEHFLSNCELGYFDQFDRLQWVKKIERTSINDTALIFEMEFPILTKKILLRIQGGKNKITEVAIFSKKKANENL